MFLFEEKVLPCVWVPSSFVLHTKADLPSLRFTVCSSVGARIPSVLFPRSTHHQFITRFPSNVAESQLSFQFSLVQVRAVWDFFVSVGSDQRVQYWGLIGLVWSGRSSGKFSCQERVVDVLLDTAKATGDCSSVLRFWVWYVMPFRRCWYGVIDCVPG